MLTRRLCWQSLILLSAGSASSSGSRDRKQEALSWKACRLREAARAEESTETWPLAVRTGSDQPIWPWLMEQAAYTSTVS